MNAKTLSSYAIRSPFYLAALAFLNPFPLLAQDVEEDDDDVIILDPFTVDASKDVGYKSTNSTSGTGLNTLIRDLPMPVDVINREFLDDIQATDLRESLDYSAGVFTQSFEASGSVTQFNETSPSAVGNLNDPFQNVVSIRGYTVPNQQREGFRVGGIVPAYNVVLGGNTDSITTERQEVVRGPQALLYGINVLSGIVNIIPKRPLTEFRANFSMSVGANDYIRATGDITGPIIKNVLSYRLMGAHQHMDDEYEIMFRDSERDTLALQFLYNITPRVELFVEGMISETTTRGIGPKFFEDSDFRNIYGEPVRFGYDDHTAEVQDRYGVWWPNPYIQKPDSPYGEFEDLGYFYNISGPDTYRARDEKGILGLLTITPTDALSIQLGANYTNLEEEEFTVDLNTFSDGVGPMQPNFEEDVLPTRFKPQGVLNKWIRHPEVDPAAALITSPTWDPYGYGPGEAFAFPRVDTIAESGNPQSVTTIIPPVARPGQQGPIPEEQMWWDPEVVSGATGVSGVVQPTRKYAYYSWFNRPRSAETLQLRGKIAYEFRDVEIFGMNTDHIFNLGHHFIQDEVSFVAGGVFNGNNYQAANVPAQGEPGRLDNDPLYLRDSILNTSVMHYNGENLAVPGFPSTERMGVQLEDSYIARSDWKEAKLWYRGTYAIYQGKLWDDKITIIAGARRDSYSVKEAEHLMVMDKNRATDRWLHSGETFSLPGTFVGFGDKPFDVSQLGLPQSLTENVQADLDAYRERVPGGTVEHLFEDSPEFDTYTFGASWRIIDDLSAYYLYSQGVFPNTGQRNGQYEPIDAEQTVNNEIGLKYDFIDGKLSGTVSIYRIERENATYYWSHAPAPFRWHGGEEAPVNTFEPGAFDPELAKTIPRQRPSYTISWDYLELAAQELGVTDLPPVDGNASQKRLYFENLGFSDPNVYSRPVQEAPSGFGRSEHWLLVFYEDIKANPDGLVAKAFDLAMRRAPVEDNLNPGNYIPYYGWPSHYLGDVNKPEMNNASEGRGATVTFEEEGTGIDGQLIYSPIENYQLVFGFSHQKREVVGSGFNLVDAVGPDGTNWGTEFDTWVYILGIENFEDPTRPSTFNGNGVNGLDLSFVPQETFRLWNKYSFVEGPLDGVEVGAGVRYNGSAPTSVPIGGSTLAGNAYLTPDSPEHVEFDAMLTYKREIFDLDWRFSLKVDNLLNNDKDEAIANYMSPLGEEVKRRTLIYYPGRSWRFLVSVNF